MLRYHWGRLEVFYPDREPETVPVDEDPTIAIGRAFLHAVETGERAHLRQDYADALGAWTSASKPTSRPAPAR